MQEEISRTIRSGNIPPWSESGIVRMQSLFTVQLEDNNRNVPLVSTCRPDRRLVGERGVTPDSNK